MSAIATLILLGAAASGELRQSANAWFEAGRASVEAREAVQPFVGRARNVILFVADGNGVATNYAIRLHRGQQHGGLGDGHLLPYETLPHLALVKTYNTNAQTPDSAGTATALNSGVKTRIGVVGVDDSAAHGDCAAFEGAVVDSIADVAHAWGKSVGVVSTARITHATPAAVYAHSVDRGWESDARIPEGCEQKDIAAQLIEEMQAGRVDLALGGGRRQFLPRDVRGPEDDRGMRKDGRNLIEDAQAFGARYVFDDTSFAELKLKGKKPILGLFEGSHMQFEHHRKGEPSLAEMTAAAIEYLGKNKNGYYLMVEAGRVDHANHGNNLHRTVTDGAAFADAVQQAMELTDARETLLIVTADHAHALAFNGSCGRGSPVTGLCFGIDQAGTKHTGEPRKAMDGKAYTVAGYLNGPSGVGSGRAELTAEQAIDPNYRQQALIPMGSATHSGADVAVYARGPFAYLLDGTIEQHEIFHVMHRAMTYGDD